MYLKCILMYNMLGLVALCSCQCTDYYLFFEMDPTSINILSRENVWNKMEAAPNSTKFRGIDKSCVVTLKCNEGLSITNCLMKRTIKDKMSNIMITSTESNNFILNATELNVTGEEKVENNNITSKVSPITDMSIISNNVTLYTTDFTSDKEVKVTTIGFILNANESSNIEHNHNITIIPTSTTLMTSNDTTQSTTETTNNTEIEITTSEVYETLENKTVKNSDEKEEMATAKKSRMNKGNVNKDIGIGVACFSVILATSALVFFAAKKIIILLQSGTYRLPSP